MLSLYYTPWRYYIYTQPTKLFLNCCIANIKKYTYSWCLDVIFYLFSDYRKIEPFRELSRSTPIFWNKVTNKAESHVIRFNKEICAFHKYSAYIICIFTTMIRILTQDWRSMQLRKNFFSWSFRKNWERLSLSHEEIMDISLLSVLHMQNQFVCIRDIMSLFLAYKLILFSLRKM